MGEKYKVCQQVIVPDDDTFQCMTFYNGDALHIRLYFRLIESITYAVHSADGLLLHRVTLYIDNVCQSLDQSRGLLLICYIGEAQ